MHEAATSLVGFHAQGSLNEQTRTLTLSTHGCKTRAPPRNRSAHPADHTRLCRPVARPAPALTMPDPQGPRQTEAALLELRTSALRGGQRAGQRGGYGMITAHLLRFTNFPPSELLKPLITLFINYYKH